MRRPHIARIWSIPLVVGTLALTACGDDAASVEASRSDGVEATTTTTTPRSAADTGPATTITGGGDVTPSSAVVPAGPSDTTVPDDGSAATSTTTTLVGPDLPTTTVAGRRLYTVTGTLGVFPVSGTICAMDAAGAGGTLEAPEGSVVDEPEVGTISYGGQITFTSTDGVDGTFQFSITAYATTFTGQGTYTISWLDGRRSGYMELTESTGHASNPVVDEDDTSDQEMIFSVVASGAC